MIEAEEEKRKAVVQGQLTMSYRRSQLTYKPRNRVPKKTSHGTTKSTQIVQLLPILQRPQPLNPRPRTNYPQQYLTRLHQKPLRPRNCHHNLLPLYLPRRTPLLRQVLGIQRRAMIWLVIRRNRPLPRMTMMIPTGSRASMRLVDHIFRFGPSVRLSIDVFV